MPAVVGDEAAVWAPARAAARVVDIGAAGELPWVAGAEEAEADGAGLGAGGGPCGDAGAVGVEGEEFGIAAGPESDSRVDVEGAVGFAPWVSCEAGRGGRDEEVFVWVEG